VRIKYPNSIYWLIDIILAIEFFYLIFFKLSTAGKMAGIPLLALGLTLLHQFFDENDYYKGMYAKGPLLAGKNIAGMWQKIIRWLITLFSFTLFVIALFNL
jgi:hypothetical protein